MTATKMKENLCSEVDLDSFERPKGPLDGLVAFRLTTSTAEDVEEELEPVSPPPTSSPRTLSHSSSMGSIGPSAVTAKLTQGASFLKGLRSQTSSKFSVAAPVDADL